MQILDNAISILDCFSSEQPELGVREAARLVSASSSSTGRLMAAMKEVGLLSQNPVTHAYSLSSRFLKYAGVYAGTIDVRNKSLAEMYRLQNQTLETISLYMMEGFERVCIERLDSPQNVRIVSRLGLRLPLYAGSAGKVFLAFMPEERCKGYISNARFTPFTSETITNPETLMNEVEKIRRQGYAYSSGEWILEASGVAAPIFDQSGEIAAALTISGPTQRFTPATIQKYVSEITHTTEKISRELGFSGNYPSISKENGK